MLLALLGALVACGQSPAERAALPTASVNLVPAAPIVAARVQSVAASPAPALPTALPPAPATPAPEAPPASDFEQYRRWMDAARAQYPYAEPAERMWDLMICESSGRPDVVAGENYGLFQYNAATWAGDWNPYRDQSIFDARAQIFATAKAWHDGSQGWWGCY